MCCLVVSASPGCCFPLFPLYPLSWNLSCQQGQSTLFLRHSRPSSLTDAWHSLPSQTGPLIRVRLLRGHVHQWCEGGQARRGEDGRSRPGCIVGPGAVCIHRYTDTLIAFFGKKINTYCQSPQLLIESIKHCTGWHVLFIISSCCVWFKHAFASLFLVTIV